MYDFNKVCAKIRQEIKGEIVDGTIRQDDFHKMQTKQIDCFHNSSDYKVMEPVRYIGPQVLLHPHLITLIGSVVSYMKLT